MNGRKILLILSISLIGSLLNAQNTVVQTGNTGVSGSLLHENIVADSTGATAILSGFANSRATVSILRYTASGALVPVESSTEWTTESLEAQSSTIDTQGRYAYTARISLNGVEHLILRASSLAAGASAGILVDLGTSSGSRDTVKVIPAADPTFWLLCRSGIRGSESLSHVRKDTGVTAQTSPVSFVGVVDTLSVNTKGHIVSKTISDSGIENQVTVFDKTFTKLWEIREPGFPPGLPGETKLQFVNGALIADDSVYLVWDRDRYFGSTATQVKNVERRNLLTGSLISQATYSDAEFLYVNKMRILDDDSLVIAEDGVKQQRVSRFSAGLAPIYATTLSWTTVGGVQSCDIDRAGNVASIGTESGTETSPTSTKVTYVDCAGQLRWIQSLDSSLDRKSEAGISIAQGGEMYASRFVQGSNPQWKVSRLEPAVFLPVTADSRGVNTSILYRSFDGNQTRLHRTGTGVTPMTITHGNGFKPLAVHITSTGGSLVLYSGTAAGSGRAYFVPPNALVPSSTTDFTLPVNSGSLRDIAMDSTNRVWVLSQVTIGSSTYAKYHRIGNAGAIDLTRTILVGGLGSGVRSFDTIGTSFRFGANIPASNGNESRIQGAFNTGAFFAEIAIPGRSNLGVADVRFASGGSALALLSDFSGDAPGALAKVDANLLTVQENVTLPFGIAQEPIGVGDGQTNGVRITWREVGGKVQLRTYNSGSFSPPTIIQALMN